MIKLKEFVDQVNEHRGRPRKEVNPEEVDTEKLNPSDNIKGKTPEQNKSHGVFAVDEPTDDDLNYALDKETMNKNVRRLVMKVKAEDDFFIQGEAGWGKTSIIKKIAKRFGRTIVTVYLDKAVATDLGGIPIPVEGKSGNAEQKLAMPAWASYMLNRPDEKFLLFFDEMNQAAPDVMNALMPIVLEHEICNIRFKNFFVGAAGNFEHENEGAITQLSGPLKSRFAPIIVWESGDWRSAFKYMHTSKQKEFGDKTWDELVGPELINKLEENAELFVNPREVEKKIIKFCYKLKKAGENDYFDAEDYVDRLEGLTKEDLNRTQKAHVAEVGEYIYKWMNGLTDDKKEGRKKRGQQMLPKILQELLTNGMKNGYFSIEGDSSQYGLAKENIAALVEIWNENNPNDQVNLEMVERQSQVIEKQGTPWKYEKNEQWKKAGYIDMLE